MRTAPFLFSETLASGVGEIDDQLLGDVSGPIDSWPSPLASVAVTQVTAFGILVKASLLQLQPPCLHYYSLF
jgi:hypothetical protein